MQDPRIRLHESVRLECTVRGSAGEALEYESENALWAELLGPHDVGWVRLDDGRILCPAHYRVSQCQDHGHRVLGWTEHPLDNGLQWRYCTRCGACFEQRVANPASRSSAGP